MREDKTVESVWIAYEVHMNVQGGFRMAIVGIATKQERAVEMLYEAATKERKAACVAGPIPLDVAAASDQRESLAGNDWPGAQSYIYWVEDGYGIPEEFVDMRGIDREHQEETNE